MSDRSPNRTPAKIVQDRVNRAAAAIEEVAHPRWIATPEEKSHVMATLIQAVESMEGRIRTPRKAFALGEVMEMSVTPEAVAPICAPCGGRHHPDPVPSGCAATPDPPDAQPGWESAKELGAESDGEDSCLRPKDG